MQSVYAIFVNKKDVLDETSPQYYIYADIMNQTDKEAILEFTDDSSLIIPQISDDGDIEYKFFIIMRDSNVNCEAFCNGVYALYNIISYAEPGLLEFIKNNSLTIVLDQLSVHEDYVTPKMVENLFSIIFNDRRKA